MAQFRKAALDGGIDAVPDAPPALREVLRRRWRRFPEWVDWDLVEAGAPGVPPLGPEQPGDILLQLWLIGGYRFGGPTDLLVATGGLSGGFDDAPSR